MFDYLIQNGTLIDGTGAPAAAGDVAIKDGKIAAVGDLKDASAGTVLDAAGKYVTPGFIDIHRHADAALFRPHFGELELKQGLTTIVNGNCGLSVTPCAGAYKKEIEAYLTPVAGALPENAVLARRRNGLSAELLVRPVALPRGFTAERTTLEEIVLLLSASAETKEEIV